MEGYAYIYFGSVMMFRRSARTVGSGGFTFLFSLLGAISPTLFLPFSCPLSPVPLIDISFLGVFLFTFLFLLLHVVK